MNTQKEGEAAVTRETLFTLQICVPKSFTDEEADAFARAYPCVTSKGWTRYDGLNCETVVQCEKFPSHVHILYVA